MTFLIIFIAISSDGLFFCSSCCLYTSHLNIQCQCTHYSPSTRCVSGKCHLLWLPCISYYKLSVTSIYHLMSQRRWHHFPTLLCPIHLRSLLNLGFRCTVLIGGWRRFKTAGLGGIQDHHSLQAHFEKNGVKKGAGHQGGCSTEGSPCLWLRC